MTGESATPWAVLNANQRRHLEVRLGRLEESLAKIEHLLRQREQSSPLVAIDDDLPPGFRGRADEELSAIRQEIWRLVSLLGLTARHTSLRRVIRATLTAEAVQVQDSLSGQLRGYGAVDPSVPERLDPALLALARSLESLAASLSHRTEATRR